MACAKPPDPSRTTPPSKACNFALNQVLDKITYAHGLISQGNLFENLERTMNSIKRAIERLEASGAADSQIRSLQGRLDQLVGEGFAALRNEAEYGTAQKRVGEKAVTGAKVIESYKDGASEKSAARASDVLSTPGHWAHEAFKKEMFRVIEASGKIPEIYKDTLARNTAMLLRVCPKAGGLVTAMVSRGQPRGSFLRRYATTGNDAIGAAYEIMATAALCEKASKPRNSKHNVPELKIDPIKDQLVFGPKAYMNHRYAYEGNVPIEKAIDVKEGNRNRKSTEGDAQCRRPHGEIGIDYKHVKGSKSRGVSKDIRNQIKAATANIEAGHYAEFHFVTNGVFAPGIVKAIDAANDELLKHFAEVDQGLYLRPGASAAAAKAEVAYGQAANDKTANDKPKGWIAMHECVSSIRDDPWLGKEVS